MLRRTQVCLGFYNRHFAFAYAKAINAQNLQEWGNPMHRSYIGSLRHGKYWSPPILNATQRSIDYV